MTAPAIPYLNENTHIYKYTYTPPNLALDTMSKREREAPRERETPLMKARRMLQTQHASNPSTISQENDILFIWNRLMVQPTREDLEEAGIFKDLDDLQVNAPS